MKKINEAVLTILLFTAIALLIIYSPSAKEGAKEGIYVCEKIIIPSLLPILIICGMLSRASSASIIEKLLGGIISKLFCIPRCCAPAIIFGLIGGYPAGAVLTSSLYEQNIISAKQAKRIMRFNFSGGAAFIITAVGEISYKSKKLGIILFIVIILSSAITGILTRRGGIQAGSSAKRLSFDNALIQATEAAVKSLAVMSAYIILFSAISAIFNIPEKAMPLFEITSGICGGKKLSLPLLAFYISFGGLCVHLQLFGTIKNMKGSYLDFLFFRFLNASISYLLSKVYITLFPQGAEVFANITSPKHSLFSSSVSLSLIMIIGCAVIIFDIENRKLKLS